MDGLALTKHTYESHSKRSPANHVLTHEYKVEVHTISMLIESLL
jgi:hypothetical protein